MSNAGRAFLGLRAHSSPNLAVAATWSSTSFYNTGDTVQYGGSLWLAARPVARGQAPQGVGNGSDADRQLLLSQLNKGFANSQVTGGGLGTPTYVVTSTADSTDATAVYGTLRYALVKVQTPLWIIFDPSVFPPGSKTAISLQTSIEMYTDKTIDGRGAGVAIEQFGIQCRTDISTARTENIGKSTVNVIVAYVDFTNYPGGDSVLSFGGTNPIRRGGGDLVYLHHIEVSDTEDQMMSNSHHGKKLSRSTIDWSKFGPSPGLMMSQQMNNGYLLNLFRADSTDVTNNTVTVLDGSGNPTTHGLSAVFDIRLFMRTDQAGHPFPGGISSGANYSVRLVGDSTKALQAVTADSGSNTFTAASHGYNNGDLVVLTTGGSLPGGYHDSTGYYVINTTTNTFQLSAASGGSVKSITANGSGVQVQAMDLKKVQFSVESTPTGWNAIDITSTGTGFYTVDKEPDYFNNGKGPQWGSHHDDDLPDAMAAFMVDLPSDTFTCKGHGQVNGDQVRFWSQGSGPSSSIPGGLTQATTYYIINATTNTFQVSATSGGSAVNITSTGTTTLAFSIANSSDANNGIYTTSGHSLSVGTMVALFSDGSIMPSPIQDGNVYWVLDPLDGQKVQLTERKGVTTNVLDTVGTGTGILCGQVAVVQFLKSVNQGSITLCDFRQMKIRSPKMTAGHYHLWNNRVYKWGEPARGGGVGGCGNEIADGVQALIERSVYTPYSSSGTEAHYWSNFTSTQENIYATEPANLAINIDSACRGPVTPAAWQGGTAVIVNGLQLDDGAITRSAGTSTNIVSDSSLDWYDGVTQQVPYSYDNLDVNSDTSTVNLMLDRGAGNVQPWVKLA